MENTSVTIDINVYQALVSRIEKLEAVLYGEVKLKLTELETVLANGSLNTVKRVTKKLVDEAKSTAEVESETKSTSESKNPEKGKKVKGKATKSCTAVQINVNSDASAVLSETTTVKSDMTQGNVNISTSRMVATSSTVRTTVEPNITNSSSEVVKQPDSLVNKTINIGDTPVVFTTDMTVIKYFKENYTRYESMILAIGGLNKLVNKNPLTGKETKKVVEERNRSLRHNIWLAMRKPTELLENVVQSDVTKINDLLKLVESEHSTLKQGKKLGAGLPSGNTKNVIEINGSTAVVSDNEVNQALSPEDEN